MSAEENTPVINDDFIMSLSPDQLEQIRIRHKELMATTAIEALSPLREEYEALMEKITKEVEVYGLNANKFLSMPHNLLRRHVQNVLTNGVINGGKGRGEGKGRGAGKTVPPKYRHPSNEELTWTGRGNRPRWLTEYLEANPNVELESLLVNQQNHQD